MAKAKAKPAAKAAPAAPAPGPDLARILPWAGLAVALWASLPKYSGPFINTSDSAEFADHIVPAGIILLCSLAGIYASRRPQGPGGIRFIAGMGVLLSGLWMVATHFPLFTQTMDGGPEAASWAATIYHSASAIAVFGLGLLWSTVTWSEAGDAEPAKDKKTSTAKSK
jgi:hypothetical protein